jgi:hypothetical protein
MPTLKDIQELTSKAIRNGHFNDTHGLKDVLLEITTLAFQAGEKSKEDMVLKEIEKMEKMYIYDRTETNELYKAECAGFHQALSSLKEKIISNSK